MRGVGRLFRWSVTLCLRLANCRFCGLMEVVLCGPLVGAARREATPISDGRVPLPSGSFNSLIGETMRRSSTAVGAVSGLRANCSAAENFSPSAVREGSVGRH